ncbi:hypothetical protein DMN91_006494 [Ooceraea biroi]|uniref:Uncharacterized protein n=1 Tax=Ooceraea biroi TaxID=2015173 RepID=A0A026W483_OOCBI|nr:uncharacterized protein LOC105284335 [Ooceraea biroi]EZA49854.1 hypothetical protein X777_11835 [Ooceraea biroi]RLU22114.1 hypothetical protein DMN91_006494 [Ooceraea biroi]
MSGQLILRALLILSMLALTRCALLEMSQMLWNRTVSGGLTKIGKLDPLRVPVIKVDQSEDDISYRIILRNLEIVGLNRSALESIRIARGRLRSNLSELETGYVSYSDLRDVDTIRYRFHTMMREPDAPKESFEATVAPINRAIGIRPSSPYQDVRFDRLRQDQQGSRIFDQRDRQAFSHPHATSGGFYKSNFQASSDTVANPGNFESPKRPVYVQPVYMQMGSFQGYQRGSQGGEDVIDCEDEDVKGSSFRGSQRDSQRYKQRPGANDRRYEERIRDIEVSASEVVGTRLKNNGDARVPELYNRKQFPRSDFASIAPSSNIKVSKNRMRERSGYIDIVYADDKVNGSVKHFGNLGIESKENRRVYSIEDIMRDIREKTRFIIHNFTEGETLKKRNDMVKDAMEAKRLKDLFRYAKNYQEQQGYFEQGMQLIYHYGGMDAKDDGAPRNEQFNDPKRTKRAHPEEAVEDDVMHVILKIRVPLLRVRSQYTLTGKVGNEVLRGNGLLVGNFTDVVGHFALELKKVDKELIVRAARAKLSAEDKKINLRGMDEMGPVQVILKHGLTAVEAVAAMLADDFATKGLSEKTADALIYRMYKDLPVN